MQHAETVTFGGSRLNRAAELRGNADKIAELLEAPDTQAIALWRGKALCCGDDTLSLAQLSPTHGLFDETTVPPVFLGLNESGHAIFAYDVSAYQPPDLDSAQLAQFVDTSEQTHPSLPADHRFCELRMVMTRLTPRDAELAATAKALYGWHRSHRFCAKCGHESRMSQSGWQRDCPSCNASHFPRTDPVVIMLITHGNRVLMGRSPGWPEGMYSLLAGFVEPGETLEAAVRREVFEEAGVHVGHVGYLASQPWPYPSSLMFGCTGKALTDDIHIDPVEIEDAIWISREDMMQAFAGEHPILKPARKGAIAHFILRNWLADRLD